MQEMGSIRRAVTGSAVELAPSPVSDIAYDEVRSHVRGSSLLLAGRLLALAANLVTQVMIVRYLGRREYGALAYAVSIASMLSTFAVFGLDKSIPRFLPIYEEGREYRRLSGAVVLAVATVLLLGMATVFAVVLLSPLLARSFENPETIRLLILITIGLAPIQALDSLLVSMFGVFAKPRAIFFRRHLLGPGLQMLAAALVIANQSNVYMVALGSLLASLLGVVVCTLLLLRILNERGFARHIRIRDIVGSAREIYGFTAPLLASDLVFVLRSSLVAVLIGQFRGAEEVAGFRAALPVARLNLLVLQSFTVMFTPIAARMFAKGQRDAINLLYQRSALWIAIVSFPILALTFSSAGPLTRVMYGSKYADSAGILALLSIGHYFNAALGFNGLTLRVVGRVRFLVTVDLLGAAFSLTLSLLLIPRFGANGAAVAVCVTLIGQNLAYQAGLVREGINLFLRRNAVPYISVVAGSLGLWLMQSTYPIPLMPGLALAAAVAVLVVFLNREVLDVEATFPELKRLKRFSGMLGRGSAARTG